MNQKHTVRQEESKINEIHIKENKEEEADMGNLAVKSEETNK